MKIIYYIHNGESNYVPQVVGNATLKDALRSFEDYVRKERRDGNNPKNARLVIDSNISGVRVYNVGERGGVYRSTAKL